MTALLNHIATERRAFNFSACVSVRTQTRCESMDVDRWNKPLAIFIKDKNMAVSSVHNVTQKGDIKRYFTVDHRDDWLTSTTSMAQNIFLL